MSGPRRNTQWTQGKECFSHSALEDFVGRADGFFPMHANLNPTIGEEIVLYWRDQTRFMENLCRVRPFQLKLKTGMARNDFGPLAFLLFWVSNPDDPMQAFAAYDVYLNPHSQVQVDTWRQLAKQTQWHLFLVGEGGEQRDFFEFENTYALDDALDFILEACGPIPMVDFNRAKAQFMDEHSIENLLAEQPRVAADQTDSVHPEHSNAVATVQSKAVDLFSSPRYAALFAESTTRHQASPYVTPEHYLQEKRAELAAYLAGKTLIYLDTCHWLNLRRVMLQSPDLRPPYDRILGLLEQLRGKERICCPVSSTIFVELMKQKDPSSRAATARIMDYLSGGACVQNWLDLVRLEWRQLVARTLLGTTEAETGINPFTKAGFWAGEHLVDCLPHMDCDESVFQKLYIDLRWTMSFQDYQALPGFTPTPDSFTTDFVAEGTKLRSKASQNKARFPDLLLDARHSLASALKDDFGATLAEMCPATREAARYNVSTLMKQLVERPTPWTMPSFQIVAGAEAAVTSTNRTTVPNDMFDILHAAEAIPYFDAFLCDNPMSNLFRSKPLEYHKVYDTTILSKPPEIVAYLEGIA